MLGKLTEDWSNPKELFSGQIAGVRGQSCRAAVGEAISFARRLCVSTIASQGMPRDLVKRYEEPRRCNLLDTRYSSRDIAATNIMNAEGAQISPTRVMLASRTITR